MATDQMAREKLVQVLDDQAFDSSLRASRDRYAANDKSKLKHVKGTTERTKQRHHHEYTSAEEVQDRLRDDLSSSAAQRWQRKLEQLGLPTLHEVADEFEDLLGVGRGVPRG
jgi:hypothetical protein